MKSPIRRLSPSASAHRPASVSPGPGETVALRGPNGAGGVPGAGGRLHLRGAVAAAAPRSRACAGRPWARDPAYLDPRSDAAPTDRAPAEVHALEVSAARVDDPFLALGERGGPGHADGVERHREAPLHARLDRLADPGTVGGGRGLPDSGCRPGPARGDGDEADPEVSGRRPLLGLLPSAAS